MESGSWRVSGGRAICAVIHSKIQLPNTEGGRVGKRCGICGKMVPDRGAQYQHMRGHPVPDEAQPPEICNHEPLSVKVWWDGVVTIGDLPEGVYKTTFDAMPKVLRKVVEKENDSGPDDIGWYFPRTRQSAIELDLLYHTEWSGEFR